MTEYYQTAIDFPPVKRRKVEADFYDRPRLLSSNSAQVIGATFELKACLKHLQVTAGNASLMTPQLCQTLCDHAVDNYRVLMTMASEEPAMAAQREITGLDEKLYLELIGVPSSPARQRA